MITLLTRTDRLIAIVLVVAVLAYIGWRAATSPGQAMQFGFNGMSVGAVYALMAMGFTLVYSTVWFFDLYYGSAAALGAYGVFYLRSQESLAGQYEVNNPVVNILFALVVAGVVAWAFHALLYSRLQARFSPRLLRLLGGLLALGSGAYVALLLVYPSRIHQTFGPLLAVVAGLLLLWLARSIYFRLAGPGGLAIFTAAVGVPTAILALLGAVWLFGSEGSKLYLSWAVSCLLAGSVGLALYRGLYVYMRQRSRSPLIMLVASLGILLALSACISIVFASAPRPLPDPFGSVPWTIWGANIKGFNLFAIGASLAGFHRLACFDKVDILRARRQGHRR